MLLAQPAGICHDVLGLNYLDGLSKCAADGDTVSCAAADRPAHRIFPTGSGKKTLPHAWTGRGRSRAKSQTRMLLAQPAGICHDVLGLNYLDGLSKCAADGDTVSCAAADRPAHRIFPTGSGKKTLPHAWTGRGRSRAKSCSRCRTRVAMQLICPCLIGRKDLMTRSYPAAVGDTANAGSDK